MSKERGHDHHVLFPRKLWRAQDPTTKLREIKWLKPPLDIDVHNELHRDVPMVPAPSYTMAERINKNFVPVLFDYVASLDNLAIAIERTIEHPKLSLLERELGELMLTSIIGQRPYLVEGLILPEAA